MSDDVQQSLRTYDVTLTNSGTLTFENVWDISESGGFLYVSGAPPQCAIVATLAPGQWKGFVERGQKVDYSAPIRPESKCADCRYFDSKLGSDANDGACRRYAPSPEARLTQAVMQDSSDTTAYWPTVLVDEWCGEFVEKAA